MPDRIYQPDDLLIFQHIQKTAGTSLRWSLASQYPPWQVLRCYGSLGCHVDRDIAPRSEAWKRRIRFFITHLEFGSHEYFPQPATYMTMLREPDVRVLSYYNHQIAVGAPFADLDTFIDQMKTGLIGNYQVRALSSTSRMEKPIGEAELNRAKENLQSHFSALGFVEHFELSLTLFARVYGWSTLPYVRRNVSFVRPALESLTDLQRERLYENNALDHDLYAFARQLFEESIARHAITPDLVDRTIQQGPASRMRLTLNRVLHNLYRRLARLT